ncbi:MAG: hypothetical protein HOV80_20525 [Polyangiaceae bacterium]|nr:hypothetical protein [Polyangiaceae bacterium]
MAGTDPYRSAALVESHDTAPPTESFGEKVSTHETDPQVDRRRTAAAAALAYALALGFVLWQWRPEVTTLWRAVVLLAAFIALGLLMRRAYPPPHVRVTLFERGIAVIYPDGSWKSIAYETVDAVWYVVPRHLWVFRSRSRLEGLVLMTADRRKLPVPLFVHDAAAVLRAVVAGVTQPLVAQAEEALRAGEELDFGNIRITEVDLVAAGVRFPWKEIEATVRRGSIELTRAEDSIAKITCDGVPHPRLVCQLVRRLAARSKIEDAGYASTW